MPPTQQEVRDHVRRAQSEGSPEGMERAAEVEREGEKATLAHLRETGEDSPLREGLEEAYPKRKPAAARKPATKKG